MVLSKHHAEHYTWRENCDGWHLLKSEIRYVIQKGIQLFFY